MKMFMLKLMDRMREPSSFAGLALIWTAVNAMIGGDMGIAQGVGTALGGIGALLIGEKGNG